MILNIGDIETLPFYFTQGMTIYVYMLTADGSLVSSTVLLNGEKLQLVDDNTLPDLTPVKRNAREGLVLPAKSMTFVVLSDAQYQHCMT